MAEIFQNGQALGNVLDCAESRCKLALRDRLLRTSYNVYTIIEKAQQSDAGMLPPYTCQKRMLPPKCIINGLHVT